MYIDEGQRPAIPVAASWLRSPNPAPLGMFISAPADVEPLRAVARTAIRLTLALLSDARMREVSLPRSKSRKAPRRPVAPAGDEYLTREEAAARLEPVHEHHL